ncbi:MAG: hypothetical protein AB8B55_18540 [Mariniblastus sp.]
MDIDIYQQCPCHADKKIKFCCGKGIIGDLNDVLAKNKSGQPVAALDQIDRAMAKSGPKDCLLTIKTHILISNGEIEKAREANELFLSTNPKHSTGLHHRALIQLAEGNTDQAVESLQDAMDAITGNEIPISLANAFKMLGVGLYSEGKTIGGRAHLRYASALKNDSDPELQQMVHETLANPQAPLVLKQDFALSPPIEGVEWEKKYINVFRALDRGQFRKALKFLTKIDEAFPDQPIVVQGLALVNGYLGRTEALVAGLRRYGKLDGIEKIKAVEAEAIAQSFDASSTTEEISIERVTFELSEMDGVSEAAISNSKLAASQPIEADPFGEGPPPRHTFMVLDRDKVLTAEGLALDNVPTVVGEMLIYGKQTDRPARIEVITSKDGRYEQVKQLVDDTFAQFLNGDPTPQEIGKSNEMSELLEWRWHLPEGVTRKQHAELVKAQRYHLMTEEWPKLKITFLDNLPIEEAAKKSEFEVPIRAMIATLENANQGQVFDDQLGKELFKKLGFSDTETLEIEETEHVSSPLLQLHLDFTKLTENQLLKVQQEAMEIGNMRVLRKVVDESLRRPEMESMPRDMSYSMMAHFSEDETEALGYLEKAREEATKADRPVGMYYVQEFEYRLSRGITDGLTELLQTIQMKHLNDPQVEYQLVRVLDRYGIGPDRGPLRGAPPQPATAPAASGVWTPDQDSPATAQIAQQPAATEEESKPSGLWIPD